ncbi:hypothetical protein DAEQUDRAFT_389597 [Daedalea quercina L-15889]|uniref:Uncharacterized protein n=1 Tax=Daedalea quercina L-15889 TaxID=1314783 RepID=A0A165NZJ7_9APHY|nr:hypothetical protein DAEQUDRAFT_389597 [Daedalea quercina L-15889]
MSAVVWPEDPLRRHPRCTVNQIRVWWGGPGSLLSHRRSVSAQPDWAGIPPHWPRVAVSQDCLRTMWWMATRLGCLTASSLASIPWTQNNLSGGYCESQPGHGPLAVDIRIIRSSLWSVASQMQRRCHEERGAWLTTRRTQFATWSRRPTTGWSLGPRSKEASGSSPPVPVC